jgi:hypothetical protein
MHLLGARRFAQLRTAEQGQRWTEVGQRKLSTVWSRDPGSAVAEAAPFDEEPALLLGSNPGPFVSVDEDTGVCPAAGLCWSRRAGLAAYPEERVKTIPLFVCG